MGRTAPRARSGLFVVLLCFLTTVADGYDLIVYGATVPNLLDEPGWHMTTGTAGLIGSWTLVGLMVGFLLAGPITDRIGRRKVMMTGIIWFSVGSAICALAQSPEFLGTARFFTGIGLGGVVPSAVALTVEYAPAARRQLYNGLNLTGYSIGGIVAALAALSLLPDHTWRLLYGLAALYILILPVMYFYLPESVNHLVLQGRTDDAQRVAARYGLDLEAICREHDMRSAEQEAIAPGRRGYRLLLSRRYVVTAALFVIISFCAQLIVYGLNTWLPQLMRQAGYPLGSSLQFLLVLQFGAVAGTLGGSLLADRFGSKRVIVTAFLIGAVSLLALSQRLDVAILMIAVAGAGLGTIGTATLTYGYVAAYFPASCRGSAVGAAMGLARVGAILGPLIGGWIAGSGVGVEWNFYVFAIPAVVAAAVASLIARPRPAPTSDEVPRSAALPDPVN